jgi:O-antigen/teichoic acid export membrane protein
MNKFLLKITGVTLILAIIGSILFYYFFEDYYLPVFPYLLLFFYSFSILTHAVQVLPAKNSFSKFARIHMVVTLLRLFVFSAIIILYLIFLKEKVASFVVVVVILYIVYTFLETRELTLISTINSKERQVE